MSRRINVIVDDDTWWILDRVTTDERSRIVNESLRAWVIQHLRKDAAHEIDALRAQLPAVSTDEITRWVREDRQRGY